MPGRSIRIAFLTLAAWAVLFAPGAAAGDAAREQVSADADRVAAAIIAPTFGTDSVIVARPGRDDTGVSDEGRIPAGDQPARLAIPAPGAHVLDGDGVPTSADREEFALGTPPRAPPVD